MKRIVVISTLSLAMLYTASVRASTQFFDFNTDPTSSGLLTISGTGPDGAAWIPTDGAGAATNANDGYLQITDAVNSQRGIVIFSDFDSGAVVQGFTFEADVRIGNGTTTPADGFSVNYVRAGDPVLTGGNFAQGPDSELNMPEEGTQTGISVGFDAYANGGNPPWPPDQLPGIGADIVALDVRVDGMLVLQYPMPTLNGSATDPTSLQTGPNDGSGSPSSLAWAHMKVVLSTNGQLSVFYKGTEVLTNYATSYFPTPGQLVFAGRTGGLNQNQDIDNIAITTVVAALAQVAPTATGLPDGVSVQIFDSGSSVVDTTKAMTFSINNGPTVAATSFQKNGTTTTVTYDGFPTLLPVGSTNDCVITVHDTHGNTITAQRSFVVPKYGTVLANWAIASGVDTSAPGFRLLPWQSGAEPNATFYAQEQIVGLHGDNNADLTTATDGGYMDYTGVINFNINPASVGGGDAGNFQTGAGYPDALFPGIPGPNGLNGSTALEVLAFLQFPSAGMYTMGVNSDDGFVVTVGANPRDRLATVLGEFNGGRGSSDTLFSFPVMTAGIYPVRLLWENGNGELPGNGANLEWFVVQNGIKILVNDPSPTNTTGVKAFFKGPGQPAYVSQIAPYIGQTGVRPDRVVVQLTDGGTTVTPGSLQLSIDGTAQNPSSVKQGGVTTVTAKMSLANLLTPGSHTAALSWSDSGGRNSSNAWSFVVENYPTLDAGLSYPVNAVDATKPGFVLAVAQLDANTVNDNNDLTANQIDTMIDLLGGLYFPSYGTNTADTVTGGDSGIPAALNNLWYWTNTVDFNVITSPGDFTFDYKLPGMPGLTSSENYFTVGLQTYVVFRSAGFYQLGVNSDDGFRVTEGLSVTRHSLHVTGPSIEKDIAAVVTYPGNAGYGAPLPLTPIVAPAVYVDANASCPNLPAADLTNKIGVIEYNTCSGKFNTIQAAWCLQTNGALAAIVVNQPGYGLPFIGDGSGLPVTIPVLVVNGRSADGGSGDLDFWQTNKNLIVNIGADTHIRLGQDDAGKGMSDQDFGVAVPAPGAYPISLYYFQGGGGAGLEWSSTLPDSVKAVDVVRSLLNDNTDTNSLMTFQAVTARPLFTSETTANGNITLTWQGAAILQAATRLNPGDWADVWPQPGTSSYTAPASAGRFFRLRLPEPAAP